MPDKMTKILLRMCVLLLPLLISCGRSSRNVAPGIGRQLAGIDSLIAVRHGLENRRASEIAAARRAVETARNPASRLEKLNALCAAYSGYRLDSALVTAHQGLEVARTLNDPQKTASSTVILAQSLVNFGEAEKALVILDSLTARPYDPSLREMVYSAYFGAYSSLAGSSHIAADRQRAIASAYSYRDSLIAILPPKSVGHVYLSATKMQDDDRLPEALSLMEKSLADEKFARNAAFNYGLGKMYLDKGDEEKAMSALSRASYLDLADGKKEYESLIKLARLLYDSGDMNRSFDYIRCAFEDASFSHASLRTQEILEVMPVIEGAYRAYEAEHLNRIRLTAIIAIVFGLLMTIALIVLWKQFRHISRIKRLLGEYNEELANRNALLKRADDAKISHIENLLNLHASNIARNKQYRRSLVQMMAGGQYSRVADKLRSDNVDNADTHLFYELFDSTFLSMFPDFIEEINRYMKEPFAELHPTALTPEQRIMALTKFGHSSTAEISAVLQYSQQTVYNYRSAIRGMLLCPLSEFEKNIRFSPSGNL